MLNSSFMKYDMNYIYFKNVMKQIHKQSEPFHFSPGPFKMILGL